MNQNERILVVDDDKNLLYLMSLTLKNSGFPVETAENGVKALELIEAHPAEPFSVMVTDQMMPEMNGLELLRRARQFDPNLEVIIITAAGTLKAAITALRENGAYDYLLKPLESMSQLTHAVERAAAHRSLLLEREELQNQISREAERLKALIEHTGDAVIAADAAGKINVFNQNAEKLLELTEMLERDALSSLPPELTRYLHNWVETGGSSSVTFEIVWKDRSTQMVYLTPLINGSQNEGWVMILRDISHLKELDKLKTSMLNKIANQVQTPLAQSMNSLIELNVLAGNDQRLAAAVSRLTQTWERIQKWSGDLLTTVQISNSADRELHPIPLAPILTQIEGSVSSIAQKGLTLEIELEDHLPQAEADPQLLGLLLKGLAARAASRSPENGTLTIHARLNHDQIWIDVIDQGPAVDQPDLAHVFDMAFTSTSSADLSGLELAMAKTAIERMGGQVWISGETPQGNSISICLPVFQG